MGILDLNSTADSLKRSIVDPVKRACASSYAYGSAAVGKIGDACGAIDIHRLNLVHYNPGDETRTKVAVFARKFAKNAVVYALNNAYRYFPGAKALYDIYSQTIREMDTGNHEGQEERVSKHVSDSSKKSYSNGHVKSLDVDSSGLRKPENKSEDESEDEQRMSPPPVKDRVNGSKMPSRL